MITSYQAATKYAIENNLQPFDRRMIKDIGAFISTHFKRFWAPYQTEQVLNQCRFTFSREGLSTYVVIGYPDCFEPEMMARIKVLLDMKQAEKAKQATQKTIDAIEPPKPEPPVKEVRKRKRIPIKQGSSPVLPQSAKQMSGE